MVAEDGWLPVLSLLPIAGQARHGCFGPAASPTFNTRNHSVCAGDNCNITHTVATWQYGDIASGEYGIADRAFPVHTLGT